MVLNDRLFLEDSGLAESARAASVQWMRRPPRVGGNRSIDKHFVEAIRKSMSS
jgi:hypothetical protein